MSLIFILLLFYFGSLGQNQIVNKKPVGLQRVLISAEVKFHLADFFWSYFRTHDQSSEVL